MTEIENDSVDSGTIIQEIQAGYMLSERLLRPALVGVSKKIQKTMKIKEKKRRNRLVVRKKHPYKFKQRKQYNEQSNWN